jgi:hypothetical protein
MSIIITVDKKSQALKEDMMHLNMLIYLLVTKLNNCSNPFKGIFILYTRYTPILTDIDTKLKAFIPDFIPAVG